MKKQTKEELLVEVASLKEANNRWATFDAEKRKEFSKAFSWFKERTQYSGSTEYKEATWSEIFVQLGRLLAARNFYDFDGNVSELEVAVQKIQDKIQALQTPSK